MSTEQPLFTAQPSLIDFDRDVKLSAATRVQIDEPLVNIRFHAGIYDDRLRHRSPEMFHNKQTLDQVQDDMDTPTEWKAMLTELEKGDIVSAYARKNAQQVSFALDELLQERPIFFTRCKPVAVINPLRPRRAAAANMRAANPAWIADYPGTRFPAVKDRQGRLVAPDALAELIDIRDALLRFAVVGSLRRLASAPGAGMSFEGLRFALLRHSGVLSNRTAALRPAGPSLEMISAGHEPADYATSEDAKVFFNQHLLARVAKIKGDMGVAMRGLIMDPPAPYDGSDGAIEHWSRLWTTVVALDTLTWIMSAAPEGTGNNDQNICELLATRLWRSETTRFYPVWGAVLPSGHPTMAFALTLRTVLAQIFDFDAARLAEPSSIRIRMHALQEVKEGDNQYYYARNVGQVRFAVLSECLLDLDRALRLGLIPDLHVFLPRTTGVGHELGASDMRDHFTATQRLALERIDRALKARDSRNDDFSSLSFSDDEDEGIETDADLWSHAEVDFRADDANGSLLGTVDVLARMDQASAWMDVTCVLRMANREYRLPIRAEPVPMGPGDQSRRLRLWFARHGDVDVDLPSSVTAARLREALSSSARAFWTSAGAGSGIFVVALIDLER